MGLLKSLTGTFLNIILFTGFVHAQSMIMGTPNVIPPSPEVSTLFQNLNFSVNHASGIGQVTIPLYEVKSGSLSVPISITYNAAGRKVFDVTGPVGIGWSLNAGGAICRTVYGKPDDKATFPFELKKSASMTNKDDYDFLAKVYYKESDTYNDTEYDVFSYFFGPHSGKFIVDHPYGGNVGFHFLPYQPLKVIAVPGTPDDTYPSGMVDDKGITYEFGAIERSHLAYDPPTTCKLLTKITSADKKDVITFSYTPVLQTKWMNISQKVLVDNDSRISGYNFHTWSRDNPGDYSEYTIQRLTEITFKEGKVKFLFNQTTDRVKTVQLLNSSGELIKSIELVSSVMDNPIFGTTTSGIFKLDALRFLDKSNQVVQQYSFEYNTPVNFYTNERDYWGYLNNVSASPNPTPIPSNASIFAVFGYSGTGSGSYTSIQGANRNASTPDNGTLKKITYPTGGSTEFTYDMNKYQWGSNGFYTGPGLRVRQTKIVDENGAIQIKTYEYGNNGYGTISIGQFYPNLMASQKRYFPNLSKYDPYSGRSVSYRKRMYSSEFMSGIADACSDLVFYSQVVEYNGTPEHNEGKTEYHYRQGETYSLESMGRPVFPDPYSYPYGELNYIDYPYDDDLTQQHIFRYSFWQKPRLYSTRFYKKTSSASYTLTKSISNNYKYTPTDTLRGLHVIKYIESDHNDITSAGNSSEREAAKHIGMPVFQFKDYEITVGKEELEYTTEIENSQNGSIIKTTAYTYNTNLLPVTVKTTSSKGDEVNTIIKYPLDFISDPLIGPVSKAMVNAHMINYPIEQTRLKGATPLQSTKTVYKNWSNTVHPQIAPQLIQAKRGDDAFETLIHYRSYDDQGNITTVSKENDVEKVYIWGYNQTYPVAELTGVSYKNALGVLDPAIVNNTNTNDITMRMELQKIRTYFPSALVTTYTYKPLVGMTSQTDPNGRNTYFEYDGFSRLSLVRDQNNNILKKYCYNYKGRQELCAGNVNPIWQSSGKYRCVLNGSGQNTGFQESEEKDSNPTSTTYHQIRWMDNGSNTYSCPLSVTCKYSNCHSIGEGYACINGQCEQGYRVNLTPTYRYDTGMYECGYHYEFSDGSWSQDYSENNYYPCSV